MKLPILFLFLTLSFSVGAQDTTFVRSLVDSLCSPRYHGRGYVSNGDVKAAAFLERKCRELDLSPIGESYAQHFSLGVNTYPNRMTLNINEQALMPGVDFLINPQSNGISGSFKTLNFKRKWINNTSKIQTLSEKKRIRNRFVIIDKSNLNKEEASWLNQLAIANPIKARGYILLTDQKLTWSVGRRMISAPVFEVNAKSVKGSVKTVQAEVDQNWISDYQTKNVYAFIQGKVDSTVVFTAHYDHLGRMGANTYMAGASDNASGTAMLLDLAAYYKANPHHYTMVFIWFAAEEAGLVGSRYFVEHPVIELEKIKFLLNLDLMADAKKGITVVNGSVFTEAFETLSNINADEELLDQVKARGSAANSDHYPFYERGVPSFFIYTVGDYQHYHNIYDTANAIPLTNYNQVFDLVRRFVEKI